MKKLIISIGTTFFLIGCSMMPYHDKFMCEGCSNVKICKRVSEVLKESDEINKPKLHSTTIYYYNRNYYYDKKLKDMIEAISLEELQKPVKVKIVCNKSPVKNKKSNVIFKRKVKVCVYKANIRKKPSCKADVVKVVKKGSILYANALVNDAWIKVKDGYIHKSLVCKECK